MSFLSLAADFRATQAALSTASFGALLVLILALGVACGFEFINGFHDTANAVATVIYTRSLKPWAAVVGSGFLNFAGVLLGGTAVAMGIIKLLPPALLATPNPAVSMAMVFALLIAAILWNYGTWFLGIPASSSHTLIGAILGIGLANAYVSGESILHGVNWAKAAEVGLALLISPLIGFLASALTLKVAKAVVRGPAFHSTPMPGETPPWPVRLSLILTGGGVSFAHGSNDGQKGIGLIMLILIALFQGQFALKPATTGAELHSALDAAQRMEQKLAPTVARVSSSSDAILTRSAAPASGSQISTGPNAIAMAADVSATLRDIEGRLNGKSDLSSISVGERFELRRLILKADQGLSKLSRSGSAEISAIDWKNIRTETKHLRSLTDYAPLWVIALVAFAIGVGTMVGWKRVTVTIGERIGRQDLTYAQGFSAQLVAMFTIGLSAVAGLPVSTTHVLSSGIAGTMVAERAGLQPKTVRSILLAWLLTLPAAMILSSALFLIFLKIF